MVSLTKKGVGRREREAGALTAEMGQPVRDPVSSQPGPGSPALHPPPTPRSPLCLNKLPASCCMDTGACSGTRVTWLPSSALFVSA